MNSLTPSSTGAVAAPRIRGRTPLAAADLVLSVLIPVYNERNTIDRILDEVHSVPVRKQVICVDDCSSDGTRERLEQLKAAGRIDVLEFHAVNRGKGAAIRTAMAASTGTVPAGFSSRNSDRRSQTFSTRNSKGMRFSARAKRTFRE